MKKPSTASPNLEGMFYLPRDGGEGESERESSKERVLRIKKHFFRTGEEDYLTTSGDHC